MPPKKRTKATAKKNARKRKEHDPVTAENELKLQMILEDFDNQVESRIQKMNTDLALVCRQIQSIYEMEIIALPAHFHNMTKEQYMAESGKNYLENMKNVDEAVIKISSNITSVLSKIESCRQATAKKKNKPNTSIKGQKGGGTTVAKKNIACTTTRLTRKALAVMQEKATPVLQRQKILLKETPLTKSYALTSAITPKFDPKLPLTPALLRRPKVGEIVMSMSGSPLQNFVDAHETPGVIVSLGGGKILSLTDNSGFSGSLDELDQTTKSSLKLVQEKLSKMLSMP